MSKNSDLTSNASQIESNSQIAAITLNWRDPLRTERCVRALQRSGLDTIIVVDNESTGQLQGLDQVCLIELIENTGFSAGINAGIRHAMQGTSDYFLILNNDVEIEPGFLHALKECIVQYPSAGLMVPELRTPDGSELQSLLGVDPWTMRLVNVDNDGAILYPTWACVVVARETFEQIGLLDEKFFMYWEDVDFSMRMSRLDMSVVRIDGAVAVHEISSSHKNAGSAIVGYSTMGALTLASKHGGRLVIAAIILTAGRILRRIARRDSNSIISILRGVKWYYRVKLYGLQAFKVINDSKAT